MSVQPVYSRATSSTLALLAQSLAHPSEQQLQAAAQQLHDVATTARDLGMPLIAEGAEMFTSMVNLMLDGQDRGEASFAPDPALLADLCAGLQDLDALFNEQPGAWSQWEQRLNQVRQSWGEYFDLCEPRTRNDGDLWANLTSDSAASPSAGQADWCSTASEEQIHLLLSAVSQASADASTAPTAKVIETNIVPTSHVGTKDVLTTDPDTSASPDANALQADQELLEAYLDDAQRCVSSMEQIVLALTPGPQQGQQLRQFCRELHTLKGASASVGFQDLAGRLHQLEDVLQNCAQHGSLLPDQRMLLNEVDSFRRQIRQLTGRDTSSQKSSTSQPSETPRTLEGEHPGVTSEETLRVKASQLDRLMDMLAELVMLRNRRDSRVEQLKEIHGHLLQSVTRLRGWHALHEHTSVLADSESGTHLTDSLGQAANELLGIGRKLRDLFEPMAEEQRGISRFIGQFRQELTELRRLPVGGLFHRLQRAVHDAAECDDKRVRLKFTGEQTGLERSLQERLYEPLLHIVRNAVSHGIESAADRQACGKDPVGTITLEARGGTNLLSVAVRDDGRGLNYDALRRRGLELGLIDPDRSASPEELAQLIFHPGFSTRDSTSQVSGRGVGMDVVASTLERLHGWVEVESNPTQGTLIRLLIPRRSVIEHAMVFRAGGQLLALPMQFVTEVAPQASLAEGRLRCGGEELVPIHFSRLFSAEVTAASEGERILVLSTSGQTVTSRRTGRSRVAILVDNVVGPQEVVVRPLPLLLRGHPLLSGVSLSATGEIVLLLDSQRLFDWAITRVCGAREPIRRTATAPALVVDDSSAARQRIVRALRARGLASEEAQDGLEALECLRRNAYSTVWLDLEMPRMGGFELLETLQREPGALGVPVVIVSSRSDPASRERAAELGAIEFLPKPATDQDVARVLATLDDAHTGKEKAHE